jgi:hypothetical protein
MSLYKAGKDGSGKNFGNFKTLPEKEGLGVSDRGHLQSACWLYNINSAAVNLSQSLSVTMIFLLYFFP